MNLVTFLKITEIKNSSENLFDISDVNINILEDCTDSNNYKTLWVVYGFESIVNNPTKIPNE